MMEWAAVVQEGAVEVNNWFAAMAHDESAITGEGADYGRVNAPSGCQFENGCWVGGSEHHALLGFAEPGLPASQALVFTRHQVEVDVSTKFACHLADRRTQPASTAVGDSGVQPGVTSGDDHIDQALLDDRVADLH